LKNRLAGARYIRSGVVYLRHRGLTANDVFLASYPKSGNTWLKFLLCQLATKAEVDFQTAEELLPGIGHQQHSKGILPSSGRLIKTHEPYRSEYRKAILLVRDGRDVLVSYYYHNVRVGRLTGEFGDSLPILLEGKTDFYGSWHDYVHSWLDSKVYQNGDVCLVRYEDCLSTPNEVLERICGYLGITATSAEIQAAIDANTADKMRAKEAAGDDSIVKHKKPVFFVRKASKGNWRDYFSPEQHDLFMQKAGSAMKRLGYSCEYSEE
jgi:hypothetical protein